MILRKVITFEEVKEFADNLLPYTGEPTVWFSARTAWWTHDPKDLQPGTVPLDSLGAPLYCGDLKAFLKPVLTNPGHYGEYKLTTFMACHHKNFIPEPGERTLQFAKIEYFHEFVRRKVTGPHINEPVFQLETKDKPNEEQKTDSGDNAG